MKTTKHIFTELILPFVLVWFFASAFVDIVAVPTVFKFTSNLQEAGNIGMTVFSRFNKLEVLFSLIILIGVLCYENPSKLFITIAVFLLGLALFYNIVMTPAITNAAIRMHSVPVTDPQYQIFRLEHAKYHGMYKYFDSTKLLVLLIFSGLVLRKNINQKRAV